MGVLEYSSKRLDHTGHAFFRSSLHTRSFLRTPHCWSKSVAFSCKRLVALLALPLKSYSLSRDDTTRDADRFKSSTAASTLGDVSLTKSLNFSPRSVEEVPLPLAA